VVKQGKDSKWLSFRISIVLEKTRYSRGVFSLAVLHKLVCEMAG
jgi:hypothetical protein